MKTRTERPCHRFFNGLPGRGAERSGGLSDDPEAAINAAVDGDEVVLADGTYTGAGNRDFNFGGKAITVRSASGNPALCVIDCQGSGRGFYFRSGEGAGSVVEGLTVTNGRATNSSPGSSLGGGVYCRDSGPTLTNCALSGNSASRRGGGVLCGISTSATLTNCILWGDAP